MPRTYFKYAPSKGLQKAIDKNMPDSLKRAGLYVRAVARNVIRTKRRKIKMSSKPGTEGMLDYPASPPGSPVYEHTVFKKNILSGLTSDNKMCLVGPRYIKGGLNNVAKLHEFGGRKYVRDIDYNTWVSGTPIGEIGLVREGYMAKADYIGAKAEFHRDPRTGNRVFWIRIRTKTQVKGSRRLYRRYMKKYAGYRFANYPPRPYMKKALELSLPKLSGFWANSIKP